VTDRRAASGPGVAALGIALCLLAGAFGASALYVPGVTLVLLAALAETSVRLAAWRVRVTREPRVARVQESAPLRVTVTVDGSRLPFSRAELSSWPGAAFEPIGRLPAQPIGFTLRPQRRGLHAIGPSVVRFRDPFGICVRSVSSPVSEVLVLPPVERIRAEHLARIAGLTRSASRPTNVSGTEVDALRPYLPGTPASRIHWPTVARTGTLVERALHAETERLPLVVLDAQAPASIDALDRCVRAAASLCVGLAGTGGCSLLLPGAHRAQRLQRDLRGWPALHERLALVEPGGTVAWTAIERAALVLWVTARARPDVRSARGTGDVQYVVSPFAVAAATVLFGVAGCAVQRANGAVRARAA
jgi:uncharacterized protein (DUF58 family)